LAAGSGVHDPSTASDLTSYAVSPDVVSSLEFERLLSASGSYDGLIRRPSDGAPAKRFAWLQCVGSRNRKAGRDYCSSICCMFALKEAVLAHEKGGPGVETSIFYMDMRTFGKDFYRYREHAEEDHGVRLVRCRVHNLEVEPDGRLRIRYFDQKGGSWREERFDMVVLSTGQAANTAGRELAAMLDVEADEMGFFLPCGFEKVKSAKEGVFVCGSFTGLTDIGEALTSASAAASQASKLMVKLGKPFKGRVELPPERPVAREVPRVHVVLCQWNNGRMPEPVDLSNIADSLALQHGVGEVSVVETLCRGEGYDLACDLLRQSRCNRVLFGACLPYIYRQRLKTLARKAGFNPTLVEVVDIRSIIQRYLAEKDIPTLERKVERELFTALQKLRASDALALNSIPITQRALVVGGGMAGMRAALSLADRGIEVDLLERADELGGRPLKRLHFTLEGLDPAALARDLMQQVWEHKRIAVHKKAEILASNGSLGQFTTRIRNGENEEFDISHGAAIIATGGHEASTEEYCFGQSERILTQAAVEHRLATGALEPSALQTVVMIQCVGSRERGAREYCSRVCCAAALKNALKIREANPDARILILYRDMMTYGHLERYYTEARGAGILFATYDLDDKPEVSVIDGKPVVRFFDQVLRRRVQVAADLLCLSTGIEPDASNAYLAHVFGIELTRDGFFQEAESKWRPVDFLKEGFFVAGTAHSPRPIAEAIAQAEAAAQRAFTYLSRKRLTTARVVSVTHHAICSRCQTCIEVCPFEARFFDPLEDRIVVDQAACQGCGMCAAACPNGAAEVMGMNPRQALAVIEASLAQHQHV
jgi:heterodisulfide reductase subunit A